MYKVTQIPFISIFNDKYVHSLVSGGHFRRTENWPLYIRGDSF